MGYIKDITNQPNQQTFPSSTYEIADEVPAAQCSDATIQAQDGITNAGSPALIDGGKFAAWGLGGNFCTITAPPANAGDYLITLNSDNFLILQGFNPITSNENHYFVHNGGTLIQTRNLQSFADYITAQGYSYTIKGGTLYTNAPENIMSPACKILFDPLT